MTPELLQRVAKCAPEWMGAEYVPAMFFADADSVDFNPNGKANVSLTLHENHSTHAACFLMREAIRKETGRPLMLHEDSSGHWLRYAVTREPLGNGSTETIATVHAFLKVFEKEEA